MESWSLSELKFENVNYFMFNLVTLFDCSSPSSVHQYTTRSAQTNFSLQIQFMLPRVTFCKYTCFLSMQIYASHDNIAAHLFGILLVHRIKMIEFEFCYFVNILFCEPLKKMCLQAVFILFIY